MGVFCWSAAGLPCEVSPKASLARLSAVTGARGELAASRDEGAGLGGSSIPAAPALGSAGLPSGATGRASRPGLPVISDAVGADAKGRCSSTRRTVLVGDRAGAVPVEPVLVGASGETVLFGTAPVEAAGRVVEAVLP